MPRNSKCQDCELHRTSSTVCVWGDGDDDAGVMVIGEAPGQAEAKTGKPFMGKSGEILREQLARVGLGRAYITNVVKCRPPDNRTPTNDELKACRKYLDEEISTLQPRAIIALGATASKAVLRKSKITQMHGQIEEKNGIVTAAIYHPAYVLRDPSKRPAFDQDLERFARYLKDGPQDTTVEWNVVKRDNLDRFFRELDGATEVSFDLETSGLDWYNPVDRYIRCVGFGMAVNGRDVGWVIPLEMPGSPFPTPALQKRMMDTVFDVVGDRPMIAHNGKFDNIWLDQVFGRRFYLGFDTMLAHHTLDENSPHGLKELARTYLDVPEYDLSTSEKKGNTSPAKLYKYNALDCVYTLRLKRVFAKEFQSDFATRKLFQKVVMPAARAFEVIDQNGQFIRLDKFDETLRTVNARLATVLGELNEMAGREVNWNSPPQVAKLLFTDLKLEATALTPKGAPSTGEAALLEIRSQHPIAEKLVEYRELEKFRSTYLDGWKELMVGDRVYFSTKIHGTVTGRFSSRLHQVPRDGTIRHLVSAPPGWVFVQADFSQAELRVAAIMSGDPELITCYRRKIDVHWRTLMVMIVQGGTGDYPEQALRTASKLKGKKVTSVVEATELMMAAGYEECLPLWKGWKEARKKAKAVNFGFLYGMREKKFIETAKLKYGFEPTFQEASDYREGFFNLYSRLPEWHKKQVRLVHLSGHVRNLAGRKRRLPGIYSGDRSLSSEAERQAINSPVQGYIGDHKTMALIEVHETFDRETELRVVGEVHDSILLWVREGRVDELLPRVARIMENPKLVQEFGIELPVPIVADFEVGPWGDGSAFVVNRAS